PLLPYLLGFAWVWVALALSAVAAFVGGGLVARLTDRPFLRGALRQLVLGAAAAGITYLIGHAGGAGGHQTPRPGGATKQAAPAGPPGEGAAGGRPGGGRG